MGQLLSRALKFLAIPTLLVGNQAAHAQDYIQPLEPVHEDSINIDNPDYTVHYMVRLHVLQGRSVWAGSIVPIDSDRMRIRYNRESTCPAAPPMYVSVRRKDSGLWYPTNFVQGVDYYGRAIIDAIRFDLYNSSRPLECTYHIYVEAAGSEQPTPEPNELVGSALYQGGLQTGLEVDLDVTRKISAFRISLPSFCGDLQILEAGTVTEGVFSPAIRSKKDSTLFTVADGPTRAGHVRFAMNGPTDAPDCNVPVFAHFEAP